MFKTVIQMSWFCSACTPGPEIPPFGLCEWDAYAGRGCHLSVSGFLQGGEQSSQPLEMSLLQAPVGWSKEEGKEEGCKKGKNGLSVSVLLESQLVSAPYFILRCDLSFQVNKESVPRRAQAMSPQQQRGGPRELKSSTLNKPEGTAE